MADPVDHKILDSIKAPLGLQPGYDPFDVELLIHINSVIANLNQLGVGPREGLVIDKDTTWSALLEDNTKLENAKAYIYMKVRMLFDSSSMTQQLVAAWQKMIEEQEWRLTVAADPYIPQMLPLGDIFEEVD